MSRLAGPPSVRRALCSTPSDLWLVASATATLAAVAENHAFIVGQPAELLVLATAPSADVRFPVIRALVQIMGANS
jgi:hypothetical protein